MKRHFCYHWANAWALFSIILLAANAFALSPKADIMRQKLAEISMVRETMIEKKGQAAKMIWELKDQERKFRDEIKALQTRLNIVSYDEAIRFPRIKYNLKLVQQLLAYTSELDEKSVYFQTSAEKLEFLYQQADDGLRMVETLNEMKVEDLANEIDQILRKHIPKANALFIDVDGIVLEDPEKIWNNITQEK